MHKVLSYNAYAYTSSTKLVELHLGHRVIHPMSMKH